MVVKAKRQDFLEFSFAEGLLLTRGNGVISGQVYETLHDILIQPPDARHEHVAGVM